MNAYVIGALVLLVAAGIYLSLTTQNPLLSLLMGLLVGGAIVVIQARGKKS